MLPGVRPGMRIRTLSPGRGKGGHSVMKEIDGEIQIMVREEEPFGRIRGTGGLKGDHPGYLALGDAQHVQMMGLEVGRRGEGDLRQIFGPVQKILGQAL